MVKTIAIPSQPALLLEGENKNLIISDLHIGFESKFASNEIFIGKNTTTDETINEIESIIDSVKADSLILLGDIKSSIKSISKTEWEDVPKFFKKIQSKVNTILIPGNHDANIQKLVPDGVSLVSSVGLVIENILLTHGHTIPSENFSHVDKIIMGHVHPVFFQKDSVLNGQRVWVSMKAKKQNIFPSASGQIEIIIMPSFNKYFYSTEKKLYKKSISPILEKVKKIKEAKILTLDGTIIGDESNINQIF
ncbi:MAG: metallophosphoesterase [Nitrosopumilaceae archaeon]